MHSVNVSFQRRSCLSLSSSTYDEGETPTFWITSLLNRAALTSHLAKTWDPIASLRYSQLDGWLEPLEAAFLRWTGSSISGSSH